MRDPGEVSGTNNPYNIYFSTNIFMITKDESNLNWLKNAPSWPRGPYKFIVSDLNRNVGLNVCDSTVRRRFIAVRLSACRPRKKAKRKTLIFVTEVQHNLEMTGTS